MRYYLANVLDEERTCYPPDTGFPEQEQPDIIEFGITVVDLAKRCIVETRSIPVLPVRSRVSQYCTDLTGWTEEQLRLQGISFAAACAVIASEFDGLNRLTVVDCEKDLTMLEQQCRDFSVDVPLGPQRLNVSTLFSLLTGRRKHVGINKILRLLRLDSEPIRHRADSDSRAIARAFLAVLEHGIRPKVRGNLDAKATIPISGSWR